MNDVFSETQGEWVSPASQAETEHDLLQSVTESARKEFLLSQGCSVQFPKEERDFPPPLSQPSLFPPPRPASPVSTTESGDSAKASERPLRISGWQTSPLGSSDARRRSCKGEVRRALLNPQPAKDATGLFLPGGVGRVRCRSPARAARCGSRGRGAGQRPSPRQRETRVGAGGRGREGWGNPPKARSSSAACVFSPFYCLLNPQKYHRGCFFPPDTDCPSPARRFGNK